MVTGLIRILPAIGACAFMSERQRDPGRSATRIRLHSISRSVVSR